MTRLIFATDVIIEFTVDNLKEGGGGGRIDYKDARATIATRKR